MTILGLELKEEAMTTRDLPSLEPDPHAEPVSEQPLRPTVEVVKELSVTEEISNAVWFKGLEEEEEEEIDPIQLKGLQHINNGNNEGSRIWSYFW